MAINFSSYECDNETALTFCRQLKATHLMGPPTRLLSLAQFLEKSGQKLNLEGILYGGEPIRPTQFEYLATWLGTRQFAALLGSEPLFAKLFLFFCLIGT